MKAGPRFFLGCGFAALLALAGCGRSGMWGVERAAWRGQAEAQCMQSGAVKLGGAIVRAAPIEGPGMCGADFPLKVAALGESSVSMGYADVPRPPGRVGGAMPDWPTTPPRSVQSAPANGNYLPPPDKAQMRWVPGAPPAHASPSQPPQTGAPQLSAPQTYQPSDYRAPAYEEPRGAEPAPSGRAPMSIYAPGVNAPPPDDIPDDAILPKGRGPAPQPVYNAPSAPRQATYTPPPLGPSRDSRFDPMRGPQATGSIVPAAVTPPATLSCPIVSALDRWVAGGVQPAALRWFGVPVTEIRQISAYSCRQMNGAGGRGISEHAFGNALDIAAFTLADGRKIVIKNAWRNGTPEEQGFLHDVQLFACDTFNTVLAPGYNAAHYDHIHVDLMRRKSGRRPCRPQAIPGEVVAAKARAVYAARRGNKEYTGSIGKHDAIKNLIEAIPGADGLDEDDVDADDMVTGSISDEPRGWPVVIPPPRGANTGRNPADF